MAEHGQAFDGFLHLSEFTYEEHPGATELFRAWVNGLWFAPTRLRLDAERAEWGEDKLDLVGGTHPVGARARKGLTLRTSCR